MSADETKKSDLSNAGQQSHDKEPLRGQNKDDCQPEATKNKSLPFNTEQLLKAVDESSKRSRSILLLLTFTSFLTLMALVNSVKPEYNWFKMKTELNRDIIQYIVFPAERLDTANLVNRYGKNIKPVGSLSQYISANETGNLHTRITPGMRADMARLDSLYPVMANFAFQNPMLVPVLDTSWTEREVRYEKIGKALQLLYRHQIFNRPVLLNRVDELDNAEVEHLDLIRVPILGISFHVNYLGIYSGFLLTILLVLFYFSLLRERINLKITFKRGWIELKHHHYYLYEYTSMQQVLTIPRKLFTSRARRNFTYSFFSMCGIFLPLLVYLALFAYDFASLNIGKETSSTLSYATVGLDFIFAVFISIYSAKVLTQWRYLDMLWDDQTYEFNFEYILEAVGVDKEKDLVDLYPCNLKGVHLPEVKMRWYEIFAAQKEKGTPKSARISLRMLAQFINETFRDAEENKMSPEPVTATKEADDAWDQLIAWFRTEGKKNVSSYFRRSFHRMIKRLMAEPGVKEFVGGGK